MKTSLFYTLTLGMALAACNAGVDEPAPLPVDDGAEISLAVTGDAMTRRDGASDYDLDYLISESSWPGNQNYFKVDAYMQSDLSKKYIDSYVMYNTYLTEKPWRFCTTGGEQNTYYWPGNQVFDFFAYAPAMSGGAATPPSIASNGITYDGFDHEANKHTLTCDLRSFKDGDQESLTEFVYAYETDKTQAQHADTGVTLHFQHPLSAIFVRLASGFLNTDLYSVTFTGAADGANGRGIYYEGTGTCGTDGTTWTVKEGATASDFNIDIYMTMGYEMFIGNVYEKPFLVMPQTLTDRQGLEDVVIKIRYRKPNGSNTLVVTLPVTNEVKEWEAGKAYVYALDLGKDDSITVGVTVEPWSYKGDYTEVGVDEDD